MRARVTFHTDLMNEIIVGILKEHHWWPNFAPESNEAYSLINDVRDSVDERDVKLFDESKIFLLVHTVTDSRGTLSYEQSVWVLRLLNTSIQRLQIACQMFVAQFVDYATTNNKKISFQGPIQIVERKRKETIIEGTTLATPEDRRAYARTHRGVEFKIAVGGALALGVLLFLTYPWAWWSNAETPQWIRSVCEKFIGSIAVTTLISYVQYRSFRTTLREHTIRWSIPGEPDGFDNKTHPA